MIAYLIFLSWKNVRVKESSVFSRKYYTEVTKLSTLSVFEIEIWCYRGGETIPKWIDRNSGTLTESPALFEVSADRMHYLSYA